MGIINKLKADLFGGGAVETTTDESEPGPIVRFLLMIRRSLTMFTLAIGAAMVIAGIALELVLVNQGVLAAMLVIWGVSFLIIGIIGYGFIMWLRAR